MHKRERLAQGRQFGQIFQKGQSFVHPLLVLRALGNGLPYSRFGFVVGGRIGKAVLRNRVKRRMREAMRLRATQVPPGLDIVLVARMPIAKASYWRIGEALDCLLPRLGRANTAKTDQGGGSPG